LLLALLRVREALVAGVPARRVGWVGRSGQRLRWDGDYWRCPATGAAYREIGQDVLEEVVPR
ncbi:MAG: hypothetical protein LBH76_04725, partial [Propionibacteriaceae bacterium]|nr:hypothetical protein [Propionibacteriaceae bacterium]